MPQWLGAPQVDLSGWQGAPGPSGFTFPGFAAGASASAPGGWRGAWGGDAFGAFGGNGFGCNGSASGAWGGGCGNGASGNFGDGSGGGGGGNGRVQPGWTPPRTTAAHLGALPKFAPPRPPAEQRAAEHCAAEEPRAAMCPQGSEEPPAEATSFKFAPPTPPVEQRAAEEPRNAKCQQGSEKPPADAPKIPLAFAMMPTVNGPVLAETSNVDLMLKADYALFCELLFDDIAGHPVGNVAYGVEEVAEAVEQDVVAALFCPVSLGACGEAACRKVVASGGRAYLIGPQHELYNDIEMWAGAAVLVTQLKVPGDARQGQEGGAAVADEPMLDDPEAPSRGPARPRELKLVLRNLGKLASLNDRDAIPACAVAVKDRFITGLGPDLVFAAFAEAFDGAKGVAHRKAIVYVAHELFVRHRSFMKEDERRETILAHFLLKIGRTICRFKADEREAYCRLTASWQRMKVFSVDKLQQLKDSWDMD